MSSIFDTIRSIYFVSWQGTPDRSRGSIMYSIVRSFWILRASLSTALVVHLSYGEHLHTSGISANIRQNQSCQCCPHLWNVNAFVACTERASTVLSEISICLHDRLLLQGQLFSTTTWVFKRHCRFYIFVLFTNLGDHYFPGENDCVLFDTFWTVLEC